MKFSQYPYQRPDIENTQLVFNNLLLHFEGSQSAEQQIEIIRQIYAERKEFDTMAQICAIRHSINTTDNFYKQEQEYFDTHLPLYENLVHNFYKALVQSRFRNILEEKFGKQLFRLAMLAIKIFSPTIIDDLIKENTLSTQYQQLMASAQIMFEGRERNLSELIPFMRSPDRDMRIKANNARWGFLENNAEALDRIFDEMVRTRTAIAHKLGYENFVQLGYDRMMRTDYNAQMVDDYRQAVLQYVVPVANDLRKQQAERLGYETLYYFDEPLIFSAGNAKPKGNADWILENGKRMYSALGEAADTFMQFMTNHELLDLVAKKGKAGGGYCTYIAKHKAPFIFSNFNGTAADIDVLTHEVGHAFQVYCCRDFEVSEYYWPTSEAAEIHSMSMEYFAYPWMDLFFEDEADKYRYAHITEAILFLPYGVSVDAFQHVVYNNPEMTPQQRKDAWRAIERKFIPSRNYADNIFLEHGGWWQTQAHIFQSPFYYIDYTLAQICAFQFWQKDQKNHESAFNDYLVLCKAGGSLPFLELVKLAGLQSPFEKNVLSDVMHDVTQWLNTVNAELYNVPA